MCSFLVQIVYGAICFVAFCLTCGGFFSDGWSTYSYSSGVNEISQGILPYACSTSSTDCEAWFDGLPWTEKLVIACISLALAAQVISFIYNLFTLCACCCKECLMHPLIAMTVVNVILLAIAIITYAVDNNSYIPSLGTALNAKASIGYSFYLICGALVLNILNCIVAATALCCAETFC